MSRVYISARDLINTRPFGVLVPGYYKPYLNVEDTIIEPLTKNKADKYTVNSLYNYKPTVFMQPIDNDNPEVAGYTIAIMLDMFERQVEFTIMDEGDCVDIIDAIDWYMLEVRNDVMTGRQDVVEYVKKMVLFRSKIYHHYYRYMRTHPEALARIYPNHSITDNIFAIMSSLGLPKDGRENSSDPLVLKGYPIYNVEDIIPRVIGETTTAEDFGRTFGGIPDNSVKSDEIIGLDFEDFLRR